MTTKEFSLDQVLSLTSGVVLCEGSKFREIVEFMADRDLSHATKNEVFRLAVAAGTELYGQYPGLKHWRIGENVLSNGEALDSFTELLKRLTITINRPNCLGVYKTIELA